MKTNVYCLFTRDIGNPFEYYPDELVAVFTSPPTVKDLRESKVPEEVVTQYIFGKPFELLEEKFSERTFVLTIEQSKN